MKLRKLQQGITAFELMVFVALVAAVALIGYGVYNRNQTKNSNNSNPSLSSQTNPADVSTAPTINSTGDLDKASQVLDQNDPTTANSSDSSQLDSQLNAF